MIIGVDAGALSVGDKRLRVGVWRVTYELLKQLGKRDTKNVYRLYSFAPIEKSLMAVFGPRMTNVVLFPSPGYMSIRLPFELVFHPVDLFIGLSQALPSVVPTKAIGCIYDLAFLHMGKQYGDSYAALQKQTAEVVSKSLHIATISECSKKDIAKNYGIRKEKISVCYPGADHWERGKTASSPPVHIKRPFILSVGALKRAKQIPDIIRGFADFSERVKKPYDLLLVGGNYWEDPDIKKTIRTLSLEDRVLIMGHVPDALLQSYYHQAAAFVALGSWEGFCMPAVEAMKSGCPVVYAKSGALPEVVGEAGIAVDPKKSDEVGSAIKRLVTDKRKRHTSITRGKKQARQFTWGSFGNQWKHLIENML